MEVGTIGRSKGKRGPSSTLGGGTSLYAGMGSQSGRRVGELEAADGVGCIVLEFVLKLRWPNGLDTRAMEQARTVECVR